MLLRGVIDSPDIPLNVSRSYLQADGAVKKISAHITKKVADKMSSLMNQNREDYEQKWNDIKVVIEYGMISEDKFFEKSDKFALYPTVDGKYLTWDELNTAIKDNQHLNECEIKVLQIALDTILCRNFDNLRQTIQMALLSKPDLYC